MIATASIAPQTGANDNHSSPDSPDGAVNMSSYAAVTKKGLKQRVSTSCSIPIQNRFELFSVLKEVAMVEEKANNAVIVGYPAQKDRDNATKDTMKSR
jgi:hypothetical protein